MLRIASCLLALLAVDVFVSWRFPQPDPHLPWRMPRDLPTSQIDVAAAALIDDSETPKIAFVGGSPAWGDAVNSAEDAVPARFEAALRRSGHQARIVNLSSNGQLVGDSYVLAKYAADAGAEAVIVQVAYHNFNPAPRAGARARYPELAGLLGVRIDPATAKVLQCEPTPRPDVTGAVERWTRRHWLLYGARERIGSELIGSSPEQALFSAWSTYREGVDIIETESSTEGLAFAEADESMQSMMVDEWATGADYDLSSSDSESEMLRRLCTELKRKGTPVLVYLSPLNLEAVEQFGMADQEGFARNVARIRGAVEDSGGVFVDLNEPSPLPVSAFADVSHTTAEGCALTATRLLDSMAREGLLP